LNGRGLGEARGLLLGLALGLGLGVVAASGPGSAAGAGGAGAVGGVGGVGGRSAGEAGPDAPCEALRAALEQALRQALAAETALLSRTRREICPGLEARAEAPAVAPPVPAASQAPGPEATAATAPTGASEDAAPAGASKAAGGDGASKAAAAAGAAAAPSLDFGALRACRQEAERQVQSRWPLLYTDQARFRYFTPAGAALAREADALRQRRAAADCLLSSQPGHRIEESVHRPGCHQHLFVAGIERAGQQVGAAEHGAGR
jgi:hypothetical protein